MQPDRQVRGRHRLTLDPGGLSHQFADDLDPRLDGAGRAARLLNGQGAKMRPRLQPLIGQPGRNLIGLAAQTDDQDRMEVWMPGVTRQRPLQQGHVAGQRRPAAPALMCKGDHAIDALGQA
ncbi:hypothetical protein D3C72_960390 [compost metagenome]